MWLLNNYYKFVRKEKFRLKRKKRKSALLRFSGKAVIRFNLLKGFLSTEFVMDKVFPGEGIRNVCLKKYYFRNNMLSSLLAIFSLLRWALTGILWIKK